MSHDDSTARLRSCARLGQKLSYYYKAPFAALRASDLASVRLFVACDGPCSVGFR